MPSRTTTESKLVLAFLWFIFGAVAARTYTEHSWLGFPDYVHKTLCVLNTLYAFTLMIWYLSGWIRGAIYENKENNSD